MLALATACFAADGLRNNNIECDGWARSGECNNNPGFMQKECAKSCEEIVVDPAGEPEQCAGWAAQGECTRNPTYMITTCPKNCAEQRAKVHEGLLDENAYCIKQATPVTCAQEQMRKQCAGTCATFGLCAADADPDECQRALRCRELTDEKSDCPSRVSPGSCEEKSTASYLLKHCYLSCARNDLGGLLRRYRTKLSVRTRKFGLLDEDARAAALRAPPLPCWGDGSPFDEPPAATCAGSRAALLRRWRRAATPRCSWLRQTTPRAPPRRALSLPDGEKGGAEYDEERAAGAKLTVLPLSLSPKVRLVENFVTAAEASHVIKIGTPLMHRSLAGGRTESIRTSTTAMLPAGDAVVRRVTERAAYLSGYPYENIEPLQLVMYTPGQKYEPHFDYGEACDFEENLHNGHRHVTMLVYLNDVPDSYGGHTTFPKLELKVSPVARAAVAFNDCLPNGQEDPRTLHGGSPPSNGTKIAINIWIRAQPFSQRRSFF